MNGYKITLCDNKHDITNKVADKFIEIAKQTISVNELFTVALSGGSTPRHLYSILPDRISQAHLDPSKIHLFWGDERSVKPDHPESNYRLVKDTLLRNLPIPESNIHRIKAEKGEMAAEEYEMEIREFFKLQETELPEFSLAIMGMGEDGHTASLFPGATAISEEKKLVIPIFVKKLDALRLSLTPPAINNARNIIFMVSGKKKAPALYEVLEGQYNPTKFPAQILRKARKQVTWFIDKEAAALLRCVEL